MPAAEASLERFVDGHVLGLKGVCVATGIKKHMVMG